MYGISEGVSEAQGGSLQPGVHEVYIKSITLENINTSGYEGQAFDVVYVDESGTESTKRVFPFKFQAGWTDRNNSPINEKAQLTQYLSKNLHMFKYALDGTDQTYFSLVAGSNDLATYVNKLQKCTKANGGSKFKILIVAEKGKYPKYPWWQGGCSCKLSDNLLFNPEKHGYKEKDEDLMESSDNAPTNKLPF